MRKYTREVLVKVVQESASIAGCLRLLGLKQAGGTHALVSRRIKEYGLDTSHFLGRASNCGPNHRGGSHKKTAKELLVLRIKGTRQTAYRLRRALVEAGTPYRCKVCGVEAEWQGHPLKLQVNHRNRNWLDDRQENLEFLCPNCHSQTEGWCNSQGGTGLFDQAQQARTRRRRRRVAER